MCESNTHALFFHPDCSALAQLQMFRFWNNEAWSPNPQCLFEFKIDSLLTFVAMSFSSFLWMCFQVMDLCDWNLCCHTMHLWFKEQNNFKKGSMSRPLAACCWTKRMTEHTPALYQSVSTVIAILTSRSTASVHEPEKAWDALTCKHLLWNKINIRFNIRFYYSKYFAIISALILDVDQGYFPHFGSGMDFLCQNVWVDRTGKNWQLL